MYDKQKEREAALKIINTLYQDEMQNARKQNFQRAIDIAVDEITEIEQAYQAFLKQVEHLELFKEVIQEPLHKDVTRMTQNLKYMIEKNYTQEELNRMPEHVREQVRTTQDRRVELLKKVAKKYLSKPTKKE